LTQYTTLLGYYAALRKMFFEAIRFVRPTKRIASKNSFLNWPSSPNEIWNYHLNITNGLWPHCRDYYHCDHGLSLGGDSVWYENLCLADSFVSIGYLPTKWYDYIVQEYVWGSTVILRRQSSAFSYEFNILKVKQAVHIFLLYVDGMSHCKL
jgi:hypothetical protein